MKKILACLFILSLCLITGLYCQGQNLIGAQQTKKLFHVGSLKKYFKPLLEAAQTALSLSLLILTRGDMHEEIERMVKNGTFKVYLEILLETENYEQLGLILEMCMNENIVEAFKILITLITYKNGFLVDTVKIGNVEIVRTLIDRFEHDISKYEISKAFNLCYDNEKKKEIAELIENKFSDILAQEYADAFYKTTHKITGCVIS
ncbi:MAG: hypothetical protein ABH827_02325 [bacterium]